jgi:hypothetical protein
MNDPPDSRLFIQSNTLLLDVVDAVVLSPVASLPYGHRESVTMDESHPLCDTRIEKRSFGNRSLGRGGSFSSTSRRIPSTISSAWRRPANSPRGCRSKRTKSLSSCTS